MPEALLTILKFLLVALLYLFFVRVLRAVWAEVATPVRVAPVGSSRPAPSRRQRTGAKEGPPRLRVLEPPDERGRQYELDEEVTVGRADGCRIKVNDNYASQLHARIYAREGQWYVEDLGSTNGTYLNTKRVTGAVPLRRGDKLKVGKTLLEVTR